MRSRGSSKLHAKIRELYSSYSFFLCSFTDPYEMHLLVSYSAGTKSLGFEIEKEKYELGETSLSIGNHHSSTAETFALEIYHRTPLYQHRTAAIVADRIDPVLMRKTSHNYYKSCITVNDLLNISHDKTSSMLNLCPFPNENWCFLIGDVETKYWASFDGSSFLPARYDTDVRQIIFSTYINEAEVLKSSYSALRSDFKAFDLHACQNIASKKVGPLNPQQSSLFWHNQNCKKKYIEYDQAGDTHRHLTHQIPMDDASLFKNLSDVIVDPKGIQQFTEQLKHHEQN